MKSLANWERGISSGNSRGFLVISSIVSLTLEKKIQKKKEIFSGFFTIRNRMAIDPLIAHR